MAFPIVSCCVTNPKQPIEQRPRKELLSCEQKMALITDLFLAVAATTLAVLVIIASNGVNLGLLSGIGSIGAHGVYALAALAGSIVIVNVIMLMTQMAHYIRYLIAIINKDSNGAYVRKLSEKFTDISQKNSTLQLQLDEAKKKHLKDSQTISNNERNFNEFKAKTDQKLQQANQELEASKVEVKSLKDTLTQATEGADKTLKDRIKVLELESETLKAKIKTEDDIEKLESKLAAKTTELTQLEEKFLQLSNAQDKLEINKIETEQAINRSTNKQVELNESIAELTLKQTQAQEKIAELTRETETAENKAAVASEKTQQTLSKLKAEIDAKTEELSKINLESAKQELQTLKDEVLHLNNQIATLKDTQNTLEKVTLPKLNTEVTTLTDAKTQIDDDIKKKTRDAEELKSQINDLNVDITQKMNQKVALTKQDDQLQKNLSLVTTIAVNAVEQKHEGDSDHEIVAPSPTNGSSSPTNEGSSSPEDWEVLNPKPFETAKAFATNNNIKLDLTSVPKLSDEQKQQLLNEIKDKKNLNHFIHTLRLFVNFLNNNKMEIKEDTETGKFGQELQKELKKTLKMFITKDAPEDFSTALSKYFGELGEYINKEEKEKDNRICSCMFVLAEKVLELSPYQNEFEIPKSISTPDIGPSKTSNVINDQDFLKAEEQALTYKNSYNLLLLKDFSWLQADNTLKNLVKSATQQKVRELTELAENIMNKKTQMSTEKDKKNYLLQELVPLCEKMKGYLDKIKEDPKFTGRSMDQFFVQIEHTEK